MTRLNQALEWWNNNVINGRVYKCVMPERHRKVLTRNNKIQYNFGTTSSKDFYTLK